MRACRARGGYAGCTFLISKPCETPRDTRTRCGVATLGTATGVELMIPPTTPPVDISGGGASSSLIICTFCGILVGVRSWPLIRSLCTCLTTFTGAAAGGGGGGGGGGGATRKVINCCLGSASVKMSGSSTSTPTSAACKTNEIVVVLPRLVFSRPPDSIRLSSNIGFSVRPAYTTLDTAALLFAPGPIAVAATGLPLARPGLESFQA